ncbi:unnamed protein product [Moneuplotes crassus]|uniref:Peptidase C1A papain C-terminal domain-containing protein n=1 Tax=Euplotes crassus TaxID=5936 RepID=A0AAD1XDN8_EUPCR|nr:unnamed protein product [Moneuplotes crassus]
MKFIVFVLLVAVALAEVHPVNDDIVREIKETATWTPMEPEENPFAYMSVEQIKGMMGTKLRVYEDTNEEITADIPAEFDSRTAWPGKVHNIRDQGACGSCWAFGATEALSDRFNIEHDMDIVLSPQHLVSCDRSNYGCNGGYLDKAWKFMKDTGVVLDSCMPYTSGTTGKDGECFTHCTSETDDEFRKYNSDKATMTRNVQKTQQAIMEEGPVEAAFTVYQDFMSYKGGVYKHTTGSMLGGHAIKAIGWGEEDGTKYWIMANSWGTGWGEEGFFRIAMGDCGINNQMTFGLAHKN